MRDTNKEFTDAELDTLPLKVRNLVTACACNGNPYALVAEQHGLPIGTVKSRINRARAKIAKLRAANSPPPDFSATASPAVPR